MSDRPVGAVVRWTVRALLILATTIDYLDRRVLGILAATPARPGRQPLE